MWIVYFYTKISSMTRQNQKTLNQFLANLPSGVVLPSSWLTKQGISRKLQWWYSQSGWLRHLAAGSYCRTDQSISWAGTVRGLQFYLGLPIHVAAKSALILHGRSHYLPMGGLRKIILFTTPEVTIPTWLHQINEFKEELCVVKKELFHLKKPVGVGSKEIYGLEIQLSSPERAIIEVMHLVPKLQTYEEAVLLMEGLNNLRPKLVNQLMQNCKSIKAKRLFLHCAEHYNHIWLKEIDINKIDLGGGKRKIGSGGIFDSKYQISVPAIKSK